MPGCQRSRTFASAGVSRRAKALRTPSTSSIDSWSLCRGPSSRSAMCSAEETGRRSDCSGRASIFPVPQPRAIAAERSWLSSTVLPDPAQAGEHERALGPAVGDPLEHDVERGQLGVATGQLGRALPGAGGVRVPHRIHVEHRMGFSSRIRRHR